MFDSLPHPRFPWGAIDLAYTVHEIQISTSLSVVPDALITIVLKDCYIQLQWILWQYSLFLNFKRILFYQTKRSNIFFHAVMKTAIDTYLLNLHFLFKSLLITQCSYIKFLFIYLLPRFSSRVLLTADFVFTYRQYAPKNEK